MHLGMPYLACKDHAQHQFDAIVSQGSIKNENFHKQFFL